MACSLGIRTAPQVMDEVSFEGVARYIASGKVHNIITMAGAGISTSAGIPDYRSPGTGLYDQLKAEYNVTNPQELNSIEFFKKDPRPFFKRSKLFFQDVFKKGLLLRHYTQNIDTLERVAGLPEDMVVEAHGSWNTSHCMNCGKQYEKEWMKGAVMSDKVPTCTKRDCTGTIKPDIVLFGESLPERFANCAEEDFLKCDMLIILGTSLVVQPFASLTAKVPLATPRLYINREKGETGSRHPMMALIFGGGFYFDSPENTRDVFKATDCDSGCQEMADMLGWGKELREMVQREHRRIDRLNPKQTTKVPNNSQSVKSTQSLGAAKAATNSPRKSPNSSRSTRTASSGSAAKSAGNSLGKSAKPREATASHRKAGDRTESTETVAAESERSATPASADSSAVSRSSPKPASAQSCLVTSSKTAQGRSPSRSTTTKGTHGSAAKASYVTGKASPTSARGKGSPKTYSAKTADRK
ncbi:hypothetical protein BaRGS_00024323 [Batillaria attramentaria]|uniref:Deacetylase sirtuin-type domain-containing protein n=1 Tax=Batillaria attramentaria TaxID=370345 RepID=A0ABD0KBG3_9CAEN